MNFGARNFLKLLFTLVRRFYLALNWRSCDLGQLTDQSVAQQGFPIVQSVD